MHQIVVYEGKKAKRIMCFSMNWFTNAILNVQGNDQKAFCHKETWKWLSVRFADDMQKRSCKLYLIVSFEPLMR